MDRSACSTREALGLSTQDLAVEHGRNQQSAIGQKPQSRRPPGHVSNGLYRAIEFNRQDAMSVKVREVQSLIVPPRALAQTTGR